MAKKTKLGKERLYRVTWEIDIPAGSPKTAAKRALEIQRNPDSVATVFDVVSPRGKGKRIDLTENTVEDLG